MTKCRLLDELTKLLGDNGFSDLASQLVEATVCTGVMLIDGKGVGCPWCWGSAPRGR